MSWKERANRFLFTLGTYGVGLCVVLGLSFAGGKTMGPIENALSKTGEAVQAAENEMILKNRQGKRADRLNWFQPYITNPSELKHPKVILLGGSDSHTRESYETILNLEDSLHTTFPLIHIYSAWGSQDYEQFPELEVKTTLDLGSVPVITWEP